MLDVHVGIVFINTREPIKGLPLLKELAAITNIACSFSLSLFLLYESLGFISQSMCLFGKLV
jgi:hypothetical protein